MILRGNKPTGAKCKANWRGQGEIEVYDQRRMFAVTALRLDGWNGGVMERRPELDALCAKLWPAPASKPTSPSSSGHQKCLDAMLRIQLVDRSDGSHRLYSVCCRAVEHELSDAEALACVRAYERQQPFPKPWSDAVKPDTVRNVFVREVIENVKAKFPTPNGEIGFEHVRLHSFRHYFVSQAFLQGASESAIKDWVGHKDSRMVEHYRHLSDDESRRRMDQLDLLPGPTGTDGPPQAVTAP